jgi:predicted ribosomally synthesized peptide with SipW-like signal peptide
MKKKIIVTALVVCIFVLSIASATIAYFTDTKDITNTFTVGNVAIELDENKVIQDDTTGNYVANGSERTTEGINIPTSLFPKQTISKDPTITNTGSESAYFGAVITIKNGAKKVDGADVSKMLTFDGDTNVVETKAVKVNEFLSDLINSGANVTYVKEGGAVKIYIVVDAVVHAFNAAGYHHCSGQQTGILFVALGTEFFDQFLRFLFCQIAARLDCIDQQL